VLRIRDVYPGSRILIFTHPGSRIQKQQQKRGVKKICCHTFLCSHKFHKTENYFSFEVLKKKIWANFQKIIELSTQKIVSKFSKIWVWDPGSGKNLFRIPDPGVKKAPDPGSGSATLIIMSKHFLPTLFFDDLLKIAHNKRPILNLYIQGLCLLRRR
jgi:hypothetical protein